jgi:hypothetical protein
MGEALVRSLYKVLNKYQDKNCYDSSAHRKLISY